MALNTKEEKIILLKDFNGVNKAVIEKGITAPNSEKVLSIIKDNASTDVITSVNTYSEFFNHITTAYDPITGEQHKPWLQKAIFIKDMEGNAVPINPKYPNIKTQFTTGESALVYMDDVKTAFNGNGRPHFLKFMADTTLKQIGITYKSDINQLKGDTNGAWYFVDNMDGYEDYGLLESALVYKRSDTDLETWRSEEDDYMDGTEIDLLHNAAVVQLGTPATPGNPSTDAIYVFGDLSDTQQRADFIDVAQKGQWGTAIIGGVRYLFNIVDERTTPVKEFDITGIRVVDGVTTRDALEMINGTINKADAPSISSGVMLNGSLTASYASQVDNLKVITDLSDLTPGQKRTYTFPNGMTTDTVGGCELTLAYAKDGVTGAVAQSFDLRGWDTSKPIYLPITYHAGPSGTGNPIYSWIELKMEAVPGDNTQYQLTNHKSGTGATEINVFTVESIQFRGRV